MSHDPLSSSFAKRALALNDSKLDRLYNERESLSIKRTSSAFSRQEDSNEETHLHSQDDHSGTLIIDSAAPQMSPRKNLSVKIYLDDDEAVALPPELTLSEAEGAKAQTFDFVVEPSLSEATTSFVDPSSQLFTDDGSSLATAGRGLTKKASIKLSKKTSDDRKQTQSFGWLVGGSLGVMGGQGWASKLVKSSTTDTIAEDTTLGFKAPIISAAPSRFPSRPSSASSSVRSVRPAPGGKRGFSSFLSIMKNASAAAAATSSSSKPRTLSFLQGAVRRINSKIKKKKTQKPTLTSAEILSFANDRADYWMMKREYLANRARMKILYKRVKGLVNRRSAADEAKDAGENLRLIREKEEKAMGIKSSSKTASAEGKTPLHLATLLKMKAFSRTEYPSAESEHEYRVSNDDDNFSASSDNPPSSDDRASPLSSFHVIDSQQGLRNHRDLDGERSRNMVAALFGTEVAKKAVCLRVGAVDPLALPDHHRPPPPPAKEKSIAGLSDIFTAPTKSYNSMHGGPMAGRIGSTTASSNKTPPGSALVKLRKMLRRHRERLGWSIYDLEQTRAIAIERDVKEAAAAAAKKVAEDKLDASAHQSPASSPKQSLNDEEAKASEAPSPHHHHRPRVTLPEEFELVENFQVASSPVSSPLNNHSFSPDPLAHSPLPHPSPSSQAGSFNHGTVKSPLALRVLAIWRDAPDSVKKILQGSHQVIPPAHFSPQESSSQIGQAGIVRGIKTPSPHPDHSRPTSRLSARSSPLPDTSPSLPTAPIGGLNSARVDIRSASPFEVIEEASQEEPIPETPLAIDKSLLAKFDQESPAISKAPSPVPPDVTTSSNKARPASPKPSTSKAIQANSRVIRPSSPLSSSKPHSSHAASQIPKGQKGASWAMETANLERRLLKAQLAETNVELPRAVR